MSYFQATKLLDEAGLPYGVNHINNKIRTSSVPYLYDIAEGNVSGHSSFAKLGYNAAVGASEEDIWTESSLYPWIAAGGAELEIVSASANYTLAGTGAQKVKVTYLDTDYSEQSQTFNMNGVTAVPFTDTTIRRVNSIRVTQVGSLGFADGKISVKQVLGATIYRTIAAGFTRGRGAVYTVPLGKTLYLTSILVASGYTTVGRIVRWIARATVDDTAPTVKTDIFQVFFETLTEDNQILYNFEIPVRIPATADLRVSALSDPATVYCSCSLRGWLE